MILIRNLLQELVQRLDIVILGELQLFLFHGHAAAALEIGAGDVMNVDFTVIRSEASSLGRVDEGRASAIKTWTECGLI